MQAFAQSGVLTSTACVDHAHDVISICFNVSVLNRNDPPVFTSATVEFSVPAFGVVNQSIGFPLARIAYDEDATDTSWGQLTFAMGDMSMCAPQLPDGSTTAVDTVWIRRHDGQLMFASDDLRGPLGLMSINLCVVASDGGNASAVLLVLVHLQEIQMQLSIFPLSLNITHYFTGVSNHTISVSLYRGTHAGVSWSAVPVAALAWLSCAILADDALVLKLNSSALPSNMLSKQTAVLIQTTGAFVQARVRLFHECFIVLLHQSRCCHCVCFCAVCPPPLP